VHTFFPTANVLGPLAARLGSIPVILTSRRDMGYWKRRQDALLLRVVRNIPTCVVANSHAVKNQTVATEGIPPDRIIVVHNGVDAEPYRRDFHAEVAALRGKYRLPKDALIVGVVANYHRAVKGVEYFVEAASPVSAEVPEAFFFVVGFGPPEKEQHLQERIKRLHLQSRFVLTGLQSNVKPFLAMFDVAVMPSLSEGFSNSLLEYMAAGLPCVATDVGGNKEIVVDGETGFLVKPASAQALAEKIIVVLRNPGLREKMGRMAQERVRTHFWMTRMIKQLETLYEHLYLCSPQAKAAARRGFGPSGGGGHRRAFPNLTGETRHGVKTT
jgi:glycosyltransferase involved in cell wall biosynthesis